MKSFQLLSLLCLILLALLVFFQSPNSTLKTGDISFVKMDAEENSFSIKAETIISANTIIQFTDSEWDGTRFDIKENNIVWDTGEQNIPAGTIVYFSFKDKMPNASIGIVNNGLKLSKSKDAIFAYIGMERNPKRFLAGAANHKNAFGTLDNTALEIGKTAIVFDSEDQRITGKTPDWAVVEN